jgi:MFS family permease
MLITLVSGEILKISTKAKLFYFSMLGVSVCYFLMSFSVSPATFITLDFVSAVPQMLISSLIGLFMADFSRDTGMEKLNGRYVFWINVGALIAPVMAMYIAGLYGIRAPFFAVAAFNLIGLIYFAQFKIVQNDKKIPNISAKKTLRQTWRTTVAFFRRRDLASAYLINFGQYAFQGLRMLYVPIMIVQSGFDKDVVGWVLAAGIVPYVILSNPVSALAKKTGIRIWVAIGFFSLAAFAVAATMLSGRALLAVFVLWQISGALIEPLTDLFFFNVAKGADRDRFYGIFKTVSRLPRFIVPVIAAGCIMLTGATSSVWLLGAVIAGLTGLFVLLGKSK